MDTLTEEADQCCQKEFGRRQDADQLTGPFECPKCGCYYEAVDYGEIRLWECRTFAKVVR